MKVTHSYKLMFSVIAALATAIFLLEIVIIILLLCGMVDLVDLLSRKIILCITLSITWLLLSILFIHNLSEYINYKALENALFDILVYTSFGVVIWLTFALPMLQTNSFEIILLYWKPLFNLAIIGALFGFPFGFLSALRYFLYKSKGLFPQRNI